MSIYKFLETTYKPYFRPLYQLQENEANSDPFLYLESASSIEYYLLVLYLAYRGFNMCAYEYEWGAAESLKCMRSDARNGSHRLLARS